jgi:recombination protein RecT
VSSNNVPALATASQFKGFLDKLKPQLALALPKHLTADRMTRLAMSVFSSNPALAECRPHTIAASIMTAAQLGLEPNVNGQGYLIPYKGVCTFVPGWKGLVDLANRSGRCTVWTGAVFAGDDFDYGLGDNPFIRHKPGDEDDPDKLMFVYAVGRIKGQDIPVIEVWSMRKVWKHRDRYNKVGAKHYSNQQPEMYARKVPLLQVLKYMPQSIELTAALAAANAAEEGRTVTIDAETWVPVTDPSDTDDSGADDAGQQAGKPELSAEEFAKKTPSWKQAIANGKAPNDLIATAETKNTLTLAQKTEIASWAQPAAQGADS